MSRPKMPVWFLAGGLIILQMNWFESGSALSCKMTNLTVPGVHQRRFDHVVGGVPAGV